MEPLRAGDTHNRSVEVQNGALEGMLTVVVDSDHFGKDQDRDPHLSEKSDPAPR